MRFLVMVGFFCAAVLSNSQTYVYDAIQNGKKIGTLTAIRKFSRGDQIATVKMNIQQKTQVVSLTVTTTYAPSGVPRSKVANINAGGKSGNIVAKFEKLLAKVTVTAQGKTQTRTFLANSGAGTADSTIWWFVNVKPAVNTTVTYQSFNPVNMVWTETTAKYVGDGKVSYRGRRIVAHHVQENRSGQTIDIWLDEKGSAYIIDQKAIKFVRS